MIVISDSGPLIALSKINYIHILKSFFGEIHIPQAVWTEVVEMGEGRPGSEEVKQAKWITVDKVENRLGVEALKHEIGLGESEAIVLAKELKADIVLIDDKTAREIAISMELNVTGSLAVIHEAIDRKLIDGDIKDIIELMRKNNVWISDELLDTFTE